MNIKLQRLIELSGRVSTDEESLEHFHLKTEIEESLKKEVENKHLRKERDYYFLKSGILEQVKEYVESQKKVQFAVNEYGKSGSAVINELVIILGEKE